MKHYPPHPPARNQRLRIPPFHPVPTRIRSDGWTPQRQGEFIGYLAQTRSVAEAARRVGMAREGAYRLRRHKWSGGFCRAWDAALGLCAPESHTDRDVPRPKVTHAELFWRLEAGLCQVVMQDGRFTGCRWKADNTALFTALARLDRARVPREGDVAVG